MRKKLLKQSLTSLIALAFLLAFSNIQAQITTFPYSEDFDGGVLPAGYTISGGVPWQVTSGTTTSFGTGPNGDNTTGTGSYIYTETSSPASGEGLLLTPVLDLTGLAAPGLIFSYHMFGSTIGTLEAEVIDVATSTPVGLFSISGQQQASGDAPYTTVGPLDLSVYAGMSVQLRFRGTYGGSFTGDIAIDDIFVGNFENELGLSDVSVPDNFAVNTATPVTFDIDNIGANAQTGFNVSYQVAGQAAVTETFAGTIAAGASDTYTFTTPLTIAASGNYSIDFSIDLADDFPSNNTIQRDLQVLGLVDSFPYKENFESGPGDWINDGVLWELGTPSKNEITGTPNDDGTNVWVTDLTDNYPSNVDATLLGPIYDFSSFTDDPVLDMDIWWESEFSWDGAVVQSSIDGGATWQDVGAPGDPDNWYTDGTISGLGGSEDGWTGRNGSGSDGYVQAIHALDGLAGQSAVNLRIRFGSDGSVTDDGFAFDNVFVGAPEIECLDTLVVSAGNNCEAIVDYDMPELNGISGTITLTAGIASGGTFPLGVTTNSFEIPDGNGGMLTCSFDVEVIDDVGAIITSGPLDLFTGTGDNAGECGTVVNYDASAAAYEFTDNCGDVADITITLTSGIGSGGFFPVGTTTEVYTFEDMAGNTTDYSFDIVISDTTAPVIDCPDSLTVSEDENNEYIIEDYTSIISDNCTANDMMVITQDPAAGTVVGAGTTTAISLTATDEAGNVTECAFDLVVDSTLGIDGNSFSESAISIYPNPSNSMVNILTTGAQIDKAFLFDINGRILKSLDLEAVTGFELDLTSFAKGVYLLQLQSGSSSLTKRIIKN